MPRLAAIATLHADASSLAEVAEFVRLARHLGATGDTELLDGAHLRFEDVEAGIPEIPHCPPTLRDLEVLLAAARASGATDATAVAVGGDLLALDLPVRAVEEIGCGDCDLESVDVLLTTHTCLAPRS